MRVLFVAGQGAAAAFLAPLWRRWLGSDVEFRVALHRSARAVTSGISVHSLPEGVEDEAGLALALGDWRPDLVVTSLSDKPIERAGFDWSRRTRVPVWQFIDTWYDYARRLESTNGQGRLPDRLLVIDDRAKDEAVGEGIPPDIIIAVGNPAWENIEPGLTRDNRAVLFVSQPIARHWGESLGYTEKTAWQMVRNAAREHPNLFPRLVFAPHPDEDASAGEGAQERVESGQAGIYVAGYVLGMYSSVMVDAVLAGRKVISVQPNAINSDKCSLSRHGWIGRARNVSELLRLMEDRQGPSLPAGLKAAVAESCARLEKAILEPKQSCDSSA